VNNDRTEVLKGWEFALQHTFGDTGFGAILNYTIVNGDVGFNDISNWTDEQFPLLGLSDSANIIGFYDKDGIQVRVAYNWRDKFLGGIIQGEYAQRYPAYTEAYGQFDVNVSYDVNDQITVFAEGINVTGATSRVHGVHENQALWVTQGGARYNLGLRYKF
jgi:TonB-dependent receptor